jgi:hypothetical protein
MCHQDLGTSHHPQPHALLHDCLLIDRLGNHIMRDIQTRQEEIERKWDERKSTSRKEKQKEQGKRRARIKQLLGNQEWLLRNFGSRSGLPARPTTITYPRLSTPAVSCSRPHSPARPTTITDPRLSTPAVPCSLLPSSRLVTSFGTALRAAIQHSDIFLESLRVLHYLRIPGHVNNTLQEPNPTFQWWDRT